MKKKQPSKEEIVKAYLGMKKSKTKGRISGMEKNEFKLHNIKQTVEELLIEKAVKMTIQILYDKELFDKYDNAIDVLKDFLLTDKNNDRYRPELEEVNDVNP